MAGHFSALSVTQPLVNKPTFGLMQPIFFQIYSKQMKFSFLVLNLKRKWVLANLLCKFEINVGMAVTNWIVERTAFAVSIE